MEMVILGLLITVSLFTDIKDRKILNIVTLPAITFGLFYNQIIYGWDGFIYSLFGFLVGLGVFLIPYLLGGMGAGDVKLMAAIGALTGATFTFYTALSTAVIGGIVAIILIVKQRGIWQPIKSFFYSLPLLKSNLGSMVVQADKSASISFPYGIAIFLGTLVTFFWKGL